MNFSSMEFVLVFLPITLLVYFFLPHRGRNYWLLIVSLFFYAWGDSKFLTLLIVSIVFNYLIALRIDELELQSWLRKAMMIIAVVANVSLLVTFKYVNFVVENLHSLFPATKDMFEQTKLLLPLGISFFTFQSISYVIDVYRGMPAEKKLSNFTLYISFFPQLISGPIVRYPDVSEQMKHREISLESFSQGFLRFLYGFNKKMIIANLVGEVATAAFAAQSLSISMAWLGAICYSLQLFFDFCGYSDMALGLGQIFGFRFLENFNYPYISKTVSEFWRRWHISLGSWFRDYLYLPLGGSRVKTKGRMIFNLSIIWLATGIWHGANWTFIIWGLLHGFFVTIEKLMGLPKKISSHKWLAALWYCVTMVVVITGWVLFRSPDFDSAWSFIKCMFGIGSSGLYDTAFLFNLREYLVIIASAVIFSTPVYKLAKECAIAHGGKTEIIFKTFDYVFQIFLFAVSISMLVINAHNPFIYFNF